MLGMLLAVDVRHSVRFVYLYLLAVADDGAGVRVLPEGLEFRDCQVE